MRINPIQPVSFKYKSILKTYWLKGKMPSVKYDMGKNKLTKDNITNGHTLAHSKGGKTNLSNLMLETANYNFMKSNKPFSQFFDEGAFQAYCKQFEKVDLPDFNGLDYIYRITKNAYNIIKQGK